MQLNYFTAMAERSAVAPARWRRPFLLWLDGIEKGWGIPLLIAGFAAIWLLFFIIAYQSGDLHYDALETWVLGREFAWGNVKHPPLMGWVARSWTRVFPLADWSIQLLAMTNAALALWAVDLIARRFVRGDARAVVLLLLMLLPAYQFHAQRFNANTVLLALWPLATYCFLRAFETRAAAWSAAAGALAAVAMLGKYYSVFLIGSFALAALAHPQRADYFRSKSPWISMLAGLVVLGPHLHWLATTGATPISYALHAHGGVAFGQSFIEALKFLLGLAATLALPALVWVLSAEKRLLRLPADFRAMNSGLQLLFWIFIGTVALPVIVTIALGTDMPSLWALQGLFLAAVLIVCGASYALERMYVVNMMVMVGGIALAAVTIAAPIHAIYRNNDGATDRTYYRLAAAELTRRWHAAFDQPLPAVSGDEELAFAISFYSPDHPRYARQFRPEQDWRMPRIATLQKGWAAICFVDDTPCVSWLASVAAMAPHAIRSDFSVTPHLWGRPGKPGHLTALLVLPRTATTSPVPPPTADAVHDFSASQRVR